MIFLSDIIYQISQHIDIVQLVSEYVTLRKTGKNYKGLCPFHSERTPSFIVSPDKQLWHCFGCGRGGNIFNFLMQIENISFNEAAKELARRGGIPWPRTKEQRAEESRKEILFRINQKAQEYFQKNLLTTSFGKKSLNYLIRERGLSLDTIKKFKLGLALPGWENTCKFFKEQRFKMEDVEEAGLIIRREDGSYYDRFRNRIIFPIFNLSGKICGFGGRAMDKEESAKYINSPENLIFKKGSLLYGLNFARDKIREDNKIIVVEGYTDVISAHQVGMENVVASLGTSLTEGQIQLLSRFAEYVVLAYDPDIAGRTATARGGDLLQEANLKINIAILPEGEDPDELIRKEGKEVLERIFKEAPSYTQYKIDSQIKEEGELLTPEDKSKIVQKIIPILQKIPNPLRRDYYVRYTAEKLGISEAYLQKGIAMSLPQGRQSLRKGERKFLEVGINTQDRMEKEFLRYLIENKKARELARAELEVSDFENKIYQKIAEIILKINSEEIDFPRIISEIDDERVKNVLTDLVLSETTHNIKEENMEEEILGYLTWFKQKRFQKKFLKMQQVLKEVEKSGDFEKSKEVARECMEYLKIIRGKLLS